MKNLSDKIIDQIRDKKIEPVPQWQCSIRQYAYWFLVVSMIGLGGLSLALAFYAMNSLDWDASDMIHQSRVVFALKAFPYFWVALFLFSVGFAYYHYRKTSEGYKPEVATLLLFLPLFALGSGTLFHVIGINNRMHQGFSAMPLYHCMVYTKENQWSQPDAGLLGGRIMFVSGDMINLEDFQGKGWRVLYIGETEEGGGSLKRSVVVKVVGKRIGESDFEARIIRPWGDGDMMAKEEIPMFRMMGERAGR